MLVDVQQFENYLDQVQQIVLRHKSQREREDAILPLIENERSNFNDPAIYEEFLQAEISFHIGDYEEALKHYLQAKSIPFFKFFCYRASAYASKIHNELQKAQHFAEKALSIYPHDVSCLSLLSELLDPHSSQDQLQEVLSTLKHLEDDAINNTRSSDSEPPRLEPAFSFNTESFQEKEDLNKLETILLSSEPEPIQPIQIADLQKLAHRTYTIEKEAFPADSNKDHSNCINEKDLSNRIQEYKERQNTHLNNYLERLIQRPLVSDNCLFVLQGWNATHSTINAMLTEQARQTTGGFFFRWNGKGIVLNPGIHFLENFHQQGLHIRDIDYVVVTGDHPESYDNIKKIYELNYQLNRVSPELQIINYYLCQKAYQSLTWFLKPNFKQERNTVHCLELFEDSPDSEKIELSDGIVLHYFPISMQEALYQHPSNKEERSLKYTSSIGIRLELKNPYSTSSDKTTTRIAYVSGISWSPMLAHHIGSCDVLITGFGNTNPNDYGKLKYNEDCLGYFGTYSLLEEITPQILVCSELSGTEGDIRIELVKKMRQDYQASSTHKRTPPAILPGDTKLFLDLKTLKVRCSVSKALVDPHLIRIVKTNDEYGNLQYLSPECCS